MRPLPRLNRPPLSRSAALLLAAVLAALVAAPAGAEPKWSIARPVTDGKQSPLAATPLQKRAAYDKEMEAFDKLLAERNPVPLERVDVEAFAESEGRREPPRTAEQRFSDMLNEGSPELIAGRTYKGYYYDGTLFWGSDPLSFSWKNVTHWLSH
jgi:hypothetical protein